MSRLRIVLGTSSLASYLQGGGHWTVFLQYVLGLRALGHDAWLLDVLRSTGDRDRDAERIAGFFRRWRELGLEGRQILLVLAPDAEQDLERAEVYGGSRTQVRELFRSADVLWNFCCHIRQPLIGEFRRRVLLDLDPGVLQVSALEWDLGIHLHHAFLTVGQTLGDDSCQVPTLGVRWRSFPPFVYFPMWPPGPSCDQRSAYTSVTHWTWGGNLPFRKRLWSISKRDAYLRYLSLPAVTGRSFELAALIASGDDTGDRELLERHGWRIADPWRVAGSPQAYQRYIQQSRAEIMCPKPVFRELGTGWFSDRSVCYLASGRPVLAERTGFESSLPTGRGVLTFSNLEEARAGVEEIEVDYDKHSRGARELAEELFDSRRSLATMLDASA
jgi:hypothetical protein